MKSFFTYVFPFIVLLSVVVAIKLLADKIKELRDSKNALQKTITDLEFIKRKNNEESKNITDAMKALRYLEKEKTKGFPWLADAYADFLILQDMQRSAYLINKKHPALSAALTVQEITKEKRALIKENKILQYTINYYEALFPRLSDFKDIDNSDLIKIKNLETNDNNDDGCSIWLTQEEYRLLPPIKRNQLALDRYQNRKKTNWEIGRDYERYIGFIYEQNGFTVEYRGIIDGLEDMGRDLICKKDKITIIVQCKCWSKNKVIHEKHLNQLYGTTVVYALEKHMADINEYPVFPTFVTTTSLSPTAKRFADALNIDVKENISLGEYPLIKCNISKSGEKIYHLPFDQQYDKVRICNQGEFYAMTVQEAEDRGFRRAMRWRGE